MMSKPTDTQIRNEAVRFAAALGGAVNLTGGNLADSVDAKYPSMTDVEFREVRTSCAKIAGEMRAAALAKLWA
jgi:hypothetical protein